MIEPIQVGLCQCGCGQKTHVATQNIAACGLIKGQPNRFVSGHRPTMQLEDMYKVALDGCWYWQKTTQKKTGYGTLSRNGKKHLAHRFVYESKRGPIGDGLELDHVCRHRSCVNPDHLEPVTRLVNVRRSAATKLTFDKATEIKAKLTQGLSLARLGKEYGVSPAMIWQIKRGANWASPVT